MSGITISGSGVDTTVIDCSSLYRCLTVKSASSVTITGITFKNGGTQNIMSFVTRQHDATRAVFHFRLTNLTSEAELTAS